MVIGDTEFAEQVLNRRRVVMERGYTLGQVKQAVCWVARIEREELGRARRRPAVKRARELFMYLGPHHTGASLREIADRLGVRDIIDGESRGHAGRQRLAGKRFWGERVEPGS